MSISVLVAEDNLDTCYLLKEFFSLLDDMNICAITHDGQDTIAKIEELEPDVLLLDIVMPMGDGLSVIEHLHEVSLKKMPIIILTSANGQNFSDKSANAMGADYFLLKPYSLKTLYYRIKILLNDENSTIIINYKNGDISQFVIELGVPTHLLAYKYIQRALEILLQQTKTCAIGKNVYAIIARENGTTEDCVERAIRQCVVRISETGTETFNAVVGLSNGNLTKRLTASQLLKQACEYIKIKNIF